MTKHNKILILILLVLVLSLSACSLFEKEPTTSVGSSSLIVNPQNLWWFNDTVSTTHIRDYGRMTLNASSVNSARIGNTAGCRQNFTKCGYTDGTNQYYLANSNVFTDNKPYTFFCLFKPASSESNFDSYCGDNDAFYINANAGNLILNLKDGTGSYKSSTIVSSYVNSNSTWYFLWGTANTTHLCSYLNNGTIAGSCTAYNGAFSSENKFEFGGRDGAGYTKAYFQAAGIWNYTLSRTEMACVYENVVRGNRDFSNCDFGIQADNVLDLSFDTVSTCGVDSTGTHEDFVLTGNANCIEDETICKWYGCLNLTYNGGDYLSGLQDFSLTDDLSVVFWYKPTSNPETESQGFYELGVSSTSDYIYAEEGDYGINNGWKAQRGYMVDNVGNSLQSVVDTWSFYVTTYNGSHLVVYKDGSQIDSGRFVYGNLNQSIGDVINVGKAIYGIDVIGYLDEFSIYTKTLSSSEVLALYNAQRMGTPPAKDVHIANVSFMIPRNWTDTKGHNEPRLSVPFAINTSVKNSGTEATGSFAYKYQWDNGTVVKSGTISLGAGQRTWVNATIAVKDYAWRKLYLQLDTANAVVEDVENNNNYTVNIPYLDTYWSLGHNKTTIQQALTYCLTSGDLADTRCDWYRGFVSENFDNSWTGNAVDPRGKKYLENAIGCMINNYNPTKNQCIYAKNHMRGWASRTPSSYNNVQAIHELLWVTQANDIMSYNITRAQYMGNMSSYQAICQAVSTLSNTRPDLTPGLDTTYISGGNGWGFGSGIGSICDSVVGNTYPNSNNDLVVSDTYWYYNANDYWHNRIFAYMRGRGNATDSNNQERMLYKWYGENKIVPIINYLNYAGVRGFAQFNNSYCSMAKEAIYSMLDYRYNGQTLFNDESRLWRQISAGDTNAYEDIASDTENKWDILTYYGLLCKQQSVKEAIFYLRNFGDTQTTESGANGGIPAVYNYYLLNAQTSGIANLKSFQHYFFDTQNEIATFRPSYTYYNDTVLQFDGGQHKFSGHPNAQGRYHYYEGYEFLAYNQVPNDNDDVRTENFANTISYSNNTAINGYIETCGGAVLYQSYGDNLCSQIGNYPSFTYQTRAQTGAIDNEWGSSDGLYGGLLNIIPMVGVTNPIEEHVLVMDTNVIRFVKATGAPSLIMDGVLNRDKEINVHSIRNNWVNFKAFDSNTYLNFSVDYTNVTGKMYAVNSSVRYGYKKELVTPLGNGFYRRSYYQMDTKSAEWITSEVGYESVVPTKSSVVNGDDRGVTINGQTAVFDTDGNGIDFSLYTTDAWGLILINSSHIAVFNATEVFLDGDPLDSWGTPYSGLVATYPVVCTPSIVNSTWSTPVEGTCIDGLQTVSSYRVQYDDNYCGTVTPKNFWNNYTQSCGSGTPDFNSTFLRGITNLNFNIANAIGNYTPVGGNPIVRVCNNGTGVASRLDIGLDTVVPSDLRMFVDDDTTITGSVVLSTAGQTIYSTLAVDSCVDLSFWLEARDSSPTTFTFNVGYEVFG